MVQRTSDQLVEEPEHQHTNRLINETSPYLLQHAHNPVDWYPWGEAAFRAAREQDKPIFLSVGYSTCYWCHVMERESFENEAIAAIMNEHFINIKVDREERPDVDDIYMTAVQLITRQGGWPMSVWLEPEGLRPIIGGTYFPPQDSRGRPGFPSVLRQIADAWATRRDAVVQQAEQVAGAVRRTLSQAPPPAALDEQVIDRAIAMLMRSYDRNHGGFSGAPKFPTPVNLEFLIAAAWERDDVRQAVTHTLNCMALGGMYDQIGGGFHRYSVDEKWLVPHFEKMLYDNGQLLSTYAESYERTDDAFYARVLRRTCEYVQREMTGPGGGFHSAQDAEVDSREGLNYLWTEPQIRAALAEADLESDTEFTLEVYGFTRGTNFRDPHHPSDGPKNVVFLVDRPESLAAAHNITVNDVLARLDHVNEALRGVRDQREQPGLDDKILAGWNGLMIAGFADAGRVLDDPSLISAAERAAAFVLEKMRGADGSLQRTYRQQEARIDAFLEDYAFLVHGLLALHRATDDTQWLTAARELAEAARTRFHDDGVGGFFDTLESQQDLFVRTKGHYDGAVPSGNGQMVRNLVTLHERTGEPSYRDDAVRTLRFLSGHLAERSIGMTRTLEALVQLRTIAPNAAAELESSAHESATPSPGQPVALSVDEASLEPIDGGGVRFALTFDIGEGYHINARDPGQADLVPLAIEVDGDGVELRADYPSGESYGEAAYATEPIMIHRGTLRVPITLRRIDAAGPVRLVVTWQACTDEVCLQPQTQVIELAFDPAD